MDPKADKDQENMSAFEKKRAELDAIEKERLGKESKITRVMSARKNGLRAGVWYITLSNLKVLATHSQAHFDLAVKLEASKMPIAYKEAKEADGKYWLAEIKAA